MARRYKKTVLLLGACFAFAVGVLVLEMYNIEKQAETLFEGKCAQLNILATDLATTIARERNFPGEKEYYDKWLTTDLEIIDRQPYTIGLLYEQSSGSLRRITERFVDTETCSEPLDAMPPPYMGGQKSGMYMLDYEGEAFRMYYVYEPTDPPRYLLVTGVSASIVRGLPIMAMHNILFIFISVILVIAILDWRRNGKAPDMVAGSTANE